MTPELVIFIFLFVLVTIFEFFVLDDLCSRIRYLENEHDCHNNYIHTCEVEIEELETVLNELQWDVADMRCRN